MHSFVGRRSLVLLAISGAALVAVMALGSEDPALVKTTDASAFESMIVPPAGVPASRNGVLVLPVVDREMRNLDSSNTQSTSPQIVNASFIH